MKKALISPLTFQLRYSFLSILTVLILCAISLPVKAQTSPGESALFSVSCNSASGRFMPSITTNMETAVFAYADIIGGPLLGSQYGVVGDFSLQFSAASNGNYRNVFIVGVANGRDHFLGSANVGPCSGISAPTPSTSPGGISTSAPTYGPTLTPSAQCTSTHTPTPTCAFTRTPTPTHTPTPTPTVAASYTIRPFIECIEPLGGGSYRAKFGYENEAPYTVTIPIGTRNTFSAPHSNITRPICFKSGRVWGALYVTVNNGPVTWTLGEHSATASTCTPRCNTNKPPTVKIQTLPSLKCEGAETKVALDATSSTDPDGDRLSFEWSTNCAEAHFDNPTSAEATLILTEPGKGRDANCHARIAVSDGKNTTTESIPLIFPACPLDCKGIPNGATIVDKCGVCAGDGSTCHAPNCKRRDHKGTKDKIESITAVQGEVVASLVKKLQEIAKDEKDRQFVIDILTRAHQLETEQKETVRNQIPGETMHCPKNSPCAKWDLRAYTAAIIRNSSCLHFLSKKIARRIHQLTGRNCLPHERKQLKLMRELHEKIQKLVKGIPNCTSVC